MRLLVVGGTSFVGRTFIEAALAAEHHVTTFNRGRTGADVPGADVVRGDRESVTILLASLRGGRGTRCSTRRAGLVSQTSPGEPRQIPNRIRARVLALTRTTPPAALGISHWSSTEMARYIKKTEGVYVSQTWVSRLWRDNDLQPLQPWRQGTFKISKDPRFEDKSATSSVCT
jgi:uncharacterized protein YbjT (DUF2867 family)